MKNTKKMLYLLVAINILMMSKVNAGDIDNIVPETTDAMTIKQGTTELMRVQGDGKVGIGTSSPNAMLEIASDTTSRPVITLNNTSGNNRNSFINFKGTSNGETSTYNIFQWSSGQNLTISSNKTPGSTNIARFWGATGDVSIDNGELLSYGAGNNYFAGNVGVGTANPTGKLHINKTGSSEPLLKLTSSGLSGGDSSPYYGLYFNGQSQNNATEAYGGYFNTKPAHSTTPSYGIYGNTTAVSTTGYGVYGKSTHNDVNGYGTAYGVYGEAAASSGVADHRNTYAVILTIPQHAVLNLLVCM